MKYSYFSLVLSKFNFSVLAIQIIKKHFDMKLASEQKKVIIYITLKNILSQERAAQARLQDFGQGGGLFNIKIIFN